MQNLSESPEQRRFHSQTAMQPDPQEPAIMRLVQSLQTTLDISHLLTLFAESIRPDIYFNQLRYNHQQHKLYFALGTQAPHQASYHLDLQGEDLGHIILTRDTPFNEVELQLFETLLTYLIHPLKNAVVHFQTLQLAMEDGLTEVGNRRAFYQHLHQELEYSKRHPRDLSLIIIDVDNFKQYNDNFGHRAGDELLQNIVQQIKSTLRESDQLFRYGGDEFVAILRHMDKKGGELLAKRILASVSNLLYDMNQSLPAKHKVSVSLGFAKHQENDSESSLFERADQALYQAKETGKNKVCFAESISE